ncbi:hypothetical protein [Lysobacter sp. F6437]|uniref:hypothetical protein n=1 Tax=Lysobacter sp. F6437 TaxID=3459296 RepID=UPI00403E1FE4
MNMTLLVALLLMALGFGLAVTGVFVLAGAGWALLAGALGPFLFAGMILRGAARG